MAEPSEAGQAPGLRILLAHDLSALAERAADIVLQATWPSSSIVRVISSPAGIGPPLSSFANLEEVRAHARGVRVTIRQAHERLLADLRRVGVTAEATVIGGRPERSIVAEAARFRADLIVVGARGQGSIAATLLGSVSRAVVERSPCSVLVVRSPSLGRVLVATDGSASARYATSIVATWPTFADARVLLLAVGESAPRYPRAVLGTLEWRSAFRDTIASSADRACDVAEQAIADLDRASRDVDVEIRLGDLATEVTAASREWPADVVTVGAHDRSFLQRVVAESIPRRILDSVDASVLVARPPLEPTDQA